MRDRPDPAMLRRLLAYDDDTGALTWRSRVPDMFSDGCHRADTVCRRWNAKFADKPALTAISTKGYFHGSIFGRNYYAHRVCWALYAGDWPVNQVDHVDGDKLNNRINNLRDVSSAVNQRNLRLPSNNKSGHIGVRIHACGKFIASITAGGKSVHLGLFETLDSAVAARSDAEIAYGFHPNHGARR